MPDQTRLPTPKPLPASWLTKLATALRRLSRIIEFVGCNYGREYGVGHWARLKLAIRILRNYRRIESGSEVLQHLLLAEEILRVPISVQGDVVECGCYRGSMTTTLSLACALTKRRLFVCDSFEGLPTPDGDEGKIIRSDSQGSEWKKGDWASLGGVEGVKSTVAKYGAVDACTFVEGYFCDTLKDLQTDKLVLVFEDGDLITSVKDCITALWPKLHGGCKFFCHEPWSFDIVSLFFDIDWWEAELGRSRARLQGVDCRYSALGRHRLRNADRC